MVALPILHHRFDLKPFHELVGDAASVPEIVLKVSMPTLAASATNRFPDCC